MSEFRIGPTALINTVIAVVLPLLFSATPFGWFSTAGGITLLLILLSYDQGTRRSPFQSLSFSAVCALSLTFAAGSVIQRFAVNKELPIWLVVVWAAVTILGTAIDRSRMGHRPGLHAEAETAAAPAAQTAPAQAAPVRTTRTSGIGLGLSQPAAAISPQSETTLRDIDPRPTAVSREPAPLIETSLFEVQPAVPEPLEETQLKPAIAVTQPIILAAEVSPVAVTPPPAPPPPQGPETNIYVHLMGQGITMLRSVRAEHLGRDIYRIVDTMPADETWRYQPGQIVRCRKQKLSSGKALVAYEEVFLQRR